MPVTAHLVHSRTKTFLPLCYLCFVLIVHIRYVEITFFDKSPGFVCETPHMAAFVHLELLNLAMKIECNYFLLYKLFSWKNIIFREQFEAVA